VGLKAAHLLVLSCAESLAWRAQVGADTILEQPLDVHFTNVVRQCRPSSYIGHDKEVSRHCTSSSCSCSSS
jgi:hypothetical protein